MSTHLSPESRSKGGKAVQQKYRENPELLQGLKDRLAAGRANRFKQLLEAEEELKALKNHTA